MIHSHSWKLLQYCLSEMDRFSGHKCQHRQLDISDYTDLFQPQQNTHFLQAHMEHPPQNIPHSS